ncbi:MAG: hypothetical protein RL483_1141, partial [Pseudomonadota bacterium]
MKILQKRILVTALAAGLASGAAWA